MVQIFKPIDNSLGSYITGEYVFTSSVDEEVINIPHGQDFIPAFEVFYSVSDNDVLIKAPTALSFGDNLVDATGGLIIFPTVDDTNIILSVQNGFSNPPVTKDVTIYYIIYPNKANA